MISVRNLTKHYYTRNTTIVANHKISFDLEEGEFLLVVGPNGAGKTTLVLQLATLLKPTSGSIHIWGYDAVKEPEKIRPLVGLMPQEGIPNVTLTVWENLYFFSRLYGWGKSQAMSRSQDLIKTLHLEGYHNKVVGTLSGGLKRRLLLGLALTRDSKLLFLDEPTALQDLEFRSSFYQLINKILNEKRTIIYTTNDPYDIQQFGEDRKTLVLKDGQVAFFGTLNALLERTDEKDALSGLSKLIRG